MPEKERDRRRALGVCREPVSAIDNRAHKTRLTKLSSGKLKSRSKAFGSKGGVGARGLAKNTGCLMYGGVGMRFP